MTAMTPAQGRFLTALLDDLTTLAPAAGIEARTRLHATYAAGDLTKAEASRSITVVKQAIDLAKGYRLPTSAQEAVAQQFDAPVTAKAGSLDMAREAALIQSRRANADRLNLTPGKRPARKGASKARGGGVMASLRSWTPERAASLTDDGCPF